MQLIIANWKAEGSLAQLPNYVAALSAVAEMAQLVICPPSPLLAPLKAALGTMSIALGAQNCRGTGEGDSSGNPPATLLREIGCDYLIVGHADRRALGDNERIIHDKLNEAAAVGLTPIFCISDGEELLARQLMMLARTSLPQVVIAYEPMWAIGSGRTPEMAEIGAQLTLIRQRSTVLLPHTKLQVIYGGSVSPANAADILTLPDCDGVLVGKASYTGDSFAAIAKLAH